MAQGISRLPSAVPVLLCITAPLQAVLALMSETTTAGTRTAQVLVAVVSLAVGIVATRARLPRALWAAVILFGAELWLFGVLYAASPPPLEPRPLYAVVIVLHAAWVSALVLGAIPGVSLANALLLTVSSAVAILAIEVALRVYVPFSSRGVTWIGGTTPYPVIGDYYAPNTTAKTLYPDDPRRYFKRDELDPVQWRFNDQRGSGARFELPSDSQSLLRVRLPKPTADTLWLIQLTKAPVRLQKAERYALTFRGRASVRDRIIGAAVTQDHEPWLMLGLYRRVALDTGWSDHHYDFVATASDERSRLQFDFGGPASTVEVADAELLHLPDSVPVRPRTTSAYAVNYRFNDHGCRGPNLPEARPPGTTRILGIGDSYALGVGVHENDTFQSQLAALLNAQRAPGDPKYEAINCGVSGYATREARLHYQLIGSRYHPNIVILTLIFNDDRSWQDDVRLGYFRKPAKLETVFQALAIIQSLRKTRPEPDYSRSMGELVKLDSAVKANGGRLVVLVYELGFDVGWPTLKRQLADSVRGRNVPVVQLGPPLAKYPLSEMVVHRLDGHPNERAHAIAARELAKELGRANLVKLAKPVP